MTINLNVLPLADIAKVKVPQKCILSSTNIYNCGAWVRCVLQLPDEDGKQVYAVTQVYQGSTELPGGTVFLDASVTVGVDQQQYAQQLHGAVLKNLERLEEVYADEVLVTLKINAKFFKSIGKKDLLEIVKYELEAYCLIDHCAVRSERLQQMGMEAICVNIENVEYEHCYKIRNETRLHLSDVQLQTPMTKLKGFHTIGFENVLEQLREIIYRPKRMRSLINANALLVGPVGCGKDSIIKYFVQQNQCNYFHISIENVLGQYPGEAESKICEVFSAARTLASSFKLKAPIIIHLEDLHLLCPVVKAGNKDSGSSLRFCAQLNSLLDGLNSSGLNISCLASTSDAKLLHKSLLCPGRFQQEINIDPPNDVPRRRLLESLFSNRCFSDLLTDEIVDNVVSQTSGYVISDLDMLVRSIEQKVLHTKIIKFSKLIDELLAKFIPTSIRGADVSVVKCEAGFNAIGGMQTLKETLRLNILTGLRSATTYKRFGLSLPKGILLYGPPGCAKTTIAKCLAAEAKMTFIATSGAEVYSPYVGCAEKFLSKLFDTARKNAPCLLFLDEIDTLVGCRKLGTNTDNVQMRILSTLLTEMDGIVQAHFAAEAYILVVAATNRPHMIDDALLRPGRFDQLIHVPAPDRDSRLSILELHKQNMPFAADCNLVEIAERTQNYSGADICNLCNEAALYSLRKNMDASEITAVDFENILRKHKPSLSQRQIDSYCHFKRATR